MASSDETSSLLHREPGRADHTQTRVTLPAEHVYRLAAMAKRHGFSLAEYKTHATIGANATARAQVDPV